MARPRKGRRRGRGEGTVYPKSKTWTTKSGVKHQKTIWVAKSANGEVERTGATAAEAREARDRYLREHGQPVPRNQRAAPMTVAQFAEVFLEHRKRKKRPATHRDYAVTITLHILPYIGDVKLTELTDERVKAFYEILEAKVSASMRARVHRTLRAMLNYAMECKDAAKRPILRSSPLATIKQNAPRYKPSPVRPLEEGEVGSVLESAEGHRLAAIFDTALDAGARQGELFALEWTDCDFNRRTIFIQHAASETNGVVTIGPCKTGKGRRIDISPETVAALRQRQAIALKEGSGDCRLVFPSERGQVLRKSNFIRRVWEPIRKKAGIPNARFHDLRHTCAIMLLKENVHPKIVQERLGHASIKTTLDIYSAWIPTLQERAADAISHVFGRLRRKRKRANRAA